MASPPDITFRYKTEETEKMNLRKPKHVKVDNIELPSDVILSDVDSLEKLNNIQNGQVILETEKDLYLLDKEGMAFRYAKPNCLPQIMKCEKIEVHPDHFSVKVQLSQDALFEFARKQSLILFETNDGFYVPSSEIVFFSNKKCEK
jgi:hypothetical protein